MIGDAYFQLRAQIGTAFFSLLRLVTETGASEPVLAALRSAQASLREPFVFLALGPAAESRAQFLNSLFEREFWDANDASAPAAGESLAIFEYGEETRDTALSPGVVERQRPHGFLRDFTLVDAPTLADGVAAELGPHLARADTIFIVIPAGTATEDSWETLARLGRETLKRTVFILWQNDRLAEGEALLAKKRLRQAMLKKLGHACPIFALAQSDASGREKLVRWLESEVIFSTPRRARLDALDRLAEEALREAAGQPRAAEEAWRRAEERLRHLRDLLDEREEQTERQIAGALWKLAGGADGRRRQNEARWRERLSLVDLARCRVAWTAEIGEEMEAQTRRGWSEDLAVAIEDFADDLRDAEAEHRRVCRETLGEELPGDPPRFLRERVLDAAAAAASPLAFGAQLRAAIRRASGVLLPLFLAAVGASAIALGALPEIGLVRGAASLAAGALALGLLLGVLLRGQIIAGFGAHFTERHVTLLHAIEQPLRDSSREFYAALARPLEGRLSVHSAERHRHEPLLARIAQMEETFARIAINLRATNSPAPAVEAPEL